MRNLEGLEGGELSAALTPQVRMDMVQLGYNAMSPTDVQRYFNKQKPVEGLHEVAGVKEYKSLGGGAEVAAGDAGLLQEYEQETGASLTSRRPVNGNPRDEVRGAMDNYGSSLGNLDSRMQNLVERGQGERREQRVLGPGHPQNKKLISTPKQTLPIITESAKAKKVGYLMGIKYINAFIANVKAPSSINRAALMKEMNNMVLIEDKITPELIKEYRQGIASAESELYNKIKSK